MNIWIYISGNLAADSMVMLFDHLASKFPRHGYKLISDGFLPTLTEARKKQITTIDPFNTGELFTEGDLLLAGVMTPGNKERALIRQAKARKCRTIAFLNDLGGGARKFFEDGQMVLPNCIAVADLITYENLLKAGMPSFRLLKAGSIFLDSISVETNEDKKKPMRRVGYLSVPNNDDGAVWGQDLGYSELGIAQDLAELGTGMKEYTLTIRKHPKESGSSKYNVLSAKNIFIEDHNLSSIEDFIFQHSVLISSYSTGLLVAAKLGRSAVSYQPGSANPVRAKLYSSLGIPVLTDKKALQGFMNEGGMTVPSVDKALFNPGNALHTISSFLHHMLPDEYEN
jgi:hypothetical protein